MYLSLYGVLWSFGIQYKLGKSSDYLPEGMFKEVMNDLWLARISSLSNEVVLGWSLGSPWVVIGKSLGSHDAPLVQIFVIQSKPVFPLSP